MNPYRKPCDCARCRVVERERIESTFWNLVGDNWNSSEEVRLVSDLRAIETRGRISQYGGRRIPRSAEVLSFAADRGDDVDNERETCEDGA